ncbi:MAG TPA: NADAR family protein [Candidatus Paceibacterota bacterium]
MNFSVSLIFLPAGRRGANTGFNTLYFNCHNFNFPYMCGMVRTDKKGVTTMLKLLSCEEDVLFYEGPWYFLSNFSSFAVYVFGEHYPTAEHAYQTAKFKDKEMRFAIRTTSSAHEAKKLARASAPKLMANWEVFRLDNMENILRAKLTQHPYIQRKLLESGSALLIEDSQKDNFWGRGPDWKGENHLGRLWMKLRDELRANPALYETGVTK